MVIWIVPQLYLTLQSSTWIEYCYFCVKFKKLYDYNIIFNFSFHF